MKFVIPGGSGQVGTILARAFHHGGHDVVVLSRQPQRSPWRVVAWDGATLDSWQREIDGCDVVINLTGRSVNCRYTAANRDEIMQSRVAAGEHRDDLCALLRPSERRVLRHSRWP
jgi:NAD dependent epimerase/dehydratase family enzyme